MKSRGLKWEEAKNLLLTGIAPFIEFDGQVKFQNRIFLTTEGLRMQYRKEDMVEISKCNDTEEFGGCTFKVVDTPTYPGD